MPRRSWPPDLADVVRAVLLSLPEQDRAALGPFGRGEGFEAYDAHEPELAHKDGDAGGDPLTIRLRADLVARYGERKAAYVIAHELAHVRWMHPQLLADNPQLRPRLEAHADEQARRWVGHG